MAEDNNKLSEEGLYECLKSLNVIPIQLSEIKNPTKDFLIKVFEDFLKDLRIDIMHQNLRPFNAIKHIEYPGVIEEGQSIVLLVFLINSILGYSLKMCARDVIFPKPKRTKKILNYLIIFWKHFLMKYSNFQDIAVKFQEEQKEADELDEENAQLAIKYDEELSILKNKTPSKEELISCNASKLEKLKEVEKQKEIFIEEKNAAKKKVLDLETLLASTDVKIVSTKEQIKELEELILTSPDKISLEVKKLKDSILEEETKIKEREVELKDKKRRIDTLAKILQNNAKDLEEVKNINKTLQTFGDVVKSFIDDFQKFMEENENVRRLETELNIKEKLLSMNQQKSAKIHLQFKKQKESYIDTFQMLQRNLAQEQEDLIRLRAAGLELDKKMDKEVDSILEIVEKSKEAEETTKKLQMDYKSQIESIENTFVSECGIIENYIKKKYAS